MADVGATIKKRGIPDNSLSCPTYRTVFGPIETTENPQQAGFAAAVGADHMQALMFPQIQIQIGKQRAITAHTFK